MTPHQRKIADIVASLLDWFAENARDLPWRRTRDPYAIWVSEIMLQQTQVKTVLPFWERWMHALPTIEALATASSDEIHKLWEGLGYYTRVRNLQKAAQQIVAESEERQKAQRRRLKKQSELFPQEPSDKPMIPDVVPCKFPKKFEEVLALPGIGRYTAGAICSIAFNHPKALLDGNVMRVLTRIFGIEKDPREKETNELLWQFAEELVYRARAQSVRGKHKRNACSHLNQSLMELGALICTPRSPQCLLCPVNQHCVAFKEGRTEELPNLGKREAATARRFVAFLLEHEGAFLVQQRPENVVNAHLWEFPNVEVEGWISRPEELFEEYFGFAPPKLQPLPSVKHSITRYRITLDAYQVPLKRRVELGADESGKWLAHTDFDSIAFTAAHKKLASFAANDMLNNQ